MSRRNPSPALFFAFAALVACSSSEPEGTPPPPTDTGTDTATDSTVKDSGGADTNDAAPADTFDSAKPDTTVTDTGPGEDTAAKLFACGTEMCNKDFQFCRTSGSTSECVLYPTACGFASCTCLIDKTVSGTPATCKATPTPTCAETDGAFTITCDKP